MKLNFSFVSKAKVKNVLIAKNDIKRKGTSILESALLVYYIKLSTILTIRSRAFLS